LETPIIAFKCGHQYHEACIENDCGGINKHIYCTICKGKYLDISTKKEQFIKHAQEQEKFMKDLSSKTKKFNVIADYYGKGMFINLDSLGY